MYFLIMGIEKEKRNWGRGCGEGCKEEEEGKSKDGGEIGGTKKLKQPEEGSLWPCIQL